MDPKEQNLGTLHALALYYRLRTGFQEVHKGALRAEVGLGHENRSRYGTQCFCECPSCRHLSILWQKPCYFQPIAGRAQCTSLGWQSCKAGKTIAGMEPGRKPASFILTSRRKEGRQTVKGCAFGLIPCCHLLLPAWKKGIVWVWGLHKLLDFLVQLLFTHRLACRWPEPPVICFICPLVQITMYTAFSFIIGDNFINRSLRTLVQLKLQPLGIDTLMIFCVSAPHLWSMCLVHGEHLCLMETKQSLEQ